MPALRDRSRGRVARGNFPLRRSQVGSRTGARTLGSGGLSMTFVMGLNPATIITFPAPASSNAACGFPALRSPVCFLSRFMWPIFWIYFQHSAMTNPIAVKQLQFIIKPVFTPLFPAEAPAILRSSKMPPNFLFNPIFNKAKTLTGVSYRKIVNPPSKYRVD